MMLTLVFEVRMTDNGKSIDEFFEIEMNKNINQNNRNEIDSDPNGEKGKEVIRIFYDHDVINMIMMVKVMFPARLIK